MKNNKNKILIIFMILFLAFIFKINSNAKDESKFDEYLQQISTKYKDFDEALNYLDSQSKRKDLSEYDSAMNMLFKAHYNYLKKDYESVISDFEKTENILIKLNLQDELLHLYSIISSVYSTERRYEHAYIYTEKGEDLAEQLCEKYKFDKGKLADVQSDLVAIKYMKLSIALSLDLDELSERNFAEAEKLKVKLGIKERADICFNKIRYYASIKNYKMVANHYKELLEISNNRYDSRVISAAQTLIRIHIKNGEIDKAIKLINEVDSHEENPNLVSRVGKYTTYSRVYDYYGKIQDAIDCLEKAYSLLKDEKYYLSNKIGIIDSLISLYKKKEEVPNELYEKYISLKKEEEGLKSTQFLLGKVIDLELEGTKDKNKILQLRYIYILLASIIIFIAGSLRLVYLKRKNMIDGLTGTYNRKSFNLDYEAKLKKKNQFYLAVIDLDNFKSINDTYGHEFGDEVLVNTCNTIKAKMNKKSKLYRYGGEEFVLLIKSNNTEEVVKNVESIRTSIENMTWDRGIKVTVSIGISNYKDSGVDILKKADDNLYVSKNTGKNKVTI